MVLQVNVTPIKYSSDPPQEDPSQQDNEVGDITFRSGYQWQVGSYKEVGNFIPMQLYHDKLTNYKIMYFSSSVLSRASKATCTPW